MNVQNRYINKPRKNINEQILTFSKNVSILILSLGYACCTFARAVGWAEGQ